MPSTVLIVVGHAALPGPAPGWSSAVSLAGVVGVGSAVIYYFFDFLGLAQLFERKHSRAHPVAGGPDAADAAWLIVVGWSVFPFVPTDAICYVAGTLRMPIGRILLGVTLGKVPLVGFYVAGGTWVFGS